jgi:HAD superfamily hydrolase (TIGR01549 family)
MDTTARAGLISVIETCTHVLVDFDGPICKIFAGLPAASVAAELLELVVREGINIPLELQQETDPLEVFRVAGTVSRSIADRLHSVLTTAELQAVDSAIPTSNSSDFIIACRRSGRRVGIVSNNSQLAVDHYLRSHELTQHVDHVAARTTSNPNLLKPNPHLLLRSMHAFGDKPESFVMVGDSLSDIESARAAGIRHIGYANKPGKLNRFTQAGANAVITSLAELTEAVLDSTAARSRKA